MRIPELTTEQQAEAIRLRETGMSYPRIALMMRCHKMAVWKFFHPRPPRKLRAKRAPKPLKITPPLVARSVIGRCKHQVPRLDHEPTKPELYRDLAEAWSNTARIRA
jgi:hypothetical protein